MKEFRKFLLRNHIAPKWLIFSLDLVICIFAIVYANYLLSSLKIISIQIDKLWIDIAVTAFVNSIFFFILKPYDGIIRLSDFHEALRSITAVFFSFISMLMLNAFFVLFKQPLFVSNSALFVYFFIASFLLFWLQVAGKKFIQGKPAGRQYEKSSYLWRRFKGIAVNENN